MMTNWNGIINHSAYGLEAVNQFAVGELSGRQFYNLFKNTDAGGEVRNLLRKNGVTYARNLTRKALRRRGVTV